MCQTLQFQTCLIIKHDTNWFRIKLTVISPRKINIWLKMSKLLLSISVNTDIMITICMHRDSWTRYNLKFTFDNIFYTMTTWVNKFTWLSRHLIQPSFTVCDARFAKSFERQRRTLYFHCLFLWCLIFEITWFKHNIQRWEQSGGTRTKLPAESMMVMIICQYCDNRVTYNILFTAVHLFFIHCCRDNLSNIARCASV